MQVRAAVVDDAEGIAALNAATWRAGFRGLISDAYLKTYDGLPQLRHQTLAEPGDDDIQLVAVDGQQLVGWVSGGPAHDGDLGPDAYEVRACYVDPTRWRSGIGRRLMAALIDRLDTERWSHLVLWTVRDAAPTNAFYTSLGIARDGKETTLDLDGPVPIVRFTVRLARMEMGSISELRDGSPDQGAR